ncbi:hypothetical protein CXB51_020645 [Gossypium anomalum]|uniref:Uncharacterized protein n=1 Tax=Gossypium anomalum TaxID=47600 RepID=A0A8J5YXP9_9ROSI|nr:hypothetical protein CXB51_020645 [Gossypium anomalum]
MDIGYKHICGRSNGESSDGTKQDLQPKTLRKLWVQAPSRDLQNLPRLLPQWPLTLPLRIRRFLLKTGFQMLVLAAFGIEDRRTKSSKLPIVCSKTRASGATIFSSTTARTSRCIAKRAWP